VQEEQLNNSSVFAWRHYGTVHVAMVTMSAASEEQLSNSSVFGGAEMMMELVGPDKMNTGPVPETKNGPDQRKMWPSGNQQISVASNKWPDK
jgi:hypothetical protein